MKRALLALALLPPAPAEAAIRALFVGVNQYQYSKARNPAAEFADLKGTVNDVTHIKAALRDVYALDLDTPVDGCASRNAVSTTLTDACATAAAIWAELDARVAQSAPGDTVLFYFAGHGATIRDDIRFDQPSGNDTTILPTDARPPGATQIVEIIDRDLGARIDRANARGVNVVTIFDSCYSESATRDPAEGQARDAPPLTMHGLTAVPLASPPAGEVLTGKGYRVHLAAAREDQKARETTANGQTAGVFTTQLAAAMRALPGATFDDLLAETRHRVEEAGQGSQSPRGNGALKARLGGVESRVVLFEASAAGGGVTLQAGRLSGVTTGSRFALYPGSTRALAADAQPLASASVAMVNPNSATLAADPGTPALSGRLVARETQHAFGTRALLIRNLAAPADRAVVSKAIADGKVGSEGEPAQLVVRSDGASLRLATVGGEGLADLGPASDPRFTAILAQESAKVARVNDLLGLRTAPEGAELSFCISNNMTYDPHSCPPLAAGKRRSIVLGEDSRLVVRNLSDDKRYVYVFGIDEKFGVDLILPESGQNDPIDITRPLPTRVPLMPNTAGAYRFVTVATDQPIDAAAFEQSATGARGVATCASALQRALCAAMQGTRDPDAPRVGDWTAIVTDVDVVAKGGK